MSKTLTINMKAIGSDRNLTKNFCSSFASYVYVTQNVDRYLLGIPAAHCILGALLKATTTSGLDSVDMKTTGLPYQGIKTNIDYLNGTDRRFFLETSAKFSKVALAAGSLAENIKKLMQAVTMIYRGDSSRVLEVIENAMELLTRDIWKVSKALSETIQLNAESMSIVTKLLTALSQGLPEDTTTSNVLSAASSTLDLDNVLQTISDASGRASQIAKSNEKSIETIRGTYKEVSVTNIAADLSTLHTLHKSWEVDFTNIKAVANAISGLLAEVQSQTPAFAAPSNAHEGGGPQKDQMAESLLTKIYVLAAYNSVLRSVSEVGNQVSQQFAQPGLDLYSRADQAYRGDGERALDRSLQVLVEFATMANSQTSELIGQMWQRRQKDVQELMS